jgi:hypothetical protein
VHCHCIPVTAFLVNAKLGRDVGLRDGAASSNMGRAVHKAGSRCGLKFTASDLANGPLAWTLSTAKTERVGGMVGGYQNDKGTHPHGKGEKPLRHHVGIALK